MQKSVFGKLWDARAFSPDLLCLLCIFKRGMETRSQADPQRHSRHVNVKQQAQ